jgi:hypothetical protein
LWWKNKRSAQLKNRLKIALSLWERATEVDLNLKVNRVRAVGKNLGEGIPE